MDQTAVIIVNLGTPDSPSVRDVRRYLFQFLNDRRVIDLPWILQKVLVNLIIVPFRAPKSARLYRQLWDEKGSPLLYYSEEVRKQLQVLTGENYRIYHAMRYGKPDLSAVLENIENQNFNKIIIFPVFPQYSSATTGSVYEYILRRISTWNRIPELRLINHFHDHPAFIKAFATQAAKCNVSAYEHIIFSFHGLPLRQISKIHPEVNCTECRCKNETIEKSKLCYQAACYETARLIAREIDLAPDDYSVTFQSQFNKNWMMPFTDEVLIQKAQEGIKKILIFAPSFVTDCLETKVEIGIQYSHLFKEYGGEQLQLVESLNDQDFWIKALRQMIIEANN